MIERPHPHANDITQLILAVFRLNGALIEAGNRLGAPVGLTSARWQVLGVIEHGPAPVAHVARAMGLARQSVQQTADALERDGLIEFRENPHHKRARLMCLTPKGRAALDYVQAQLAEWSERIGTGLDPEQLRAATELLHSISARVERDSHDEEAS